MQYRIVKSLILLIGIICLCSLVAFGQGSDANAYFQMNHDRLDKSGGPRPLRPKSGIKNLPIEPTKEGKILLKPAAEDLVEHKQFLDESNTGIAKIYPDAKCNYLIVDVKNDKCLQAIEMAGTGSYYSFRHQGNRVNESDIHFADGSFSIVGDSNHLGFIVDLGNLPIALTNKNSVELAAIQKYQIPQTYSELNFQNIQLNKGVIFDNKLWISKTRIKLNTTYGLRIANWTDRKFNGENADLLVVMQAIRENEDGSVTFIWKKLQQKKLPKLKQTK